MATTEPCGALLLLGHGRDDAWLGTRGEPLLTRNDGGWMAHVPWVHFFACDCGRILVQALAELGCLRVAGYDLHLIIDGFDAELSDAVEQALDELCVAVSRALQAGHPDREVRAAADRAAVTLVSALDADDEVPPEADMALRALSSALTRRLRLAPPRDA